MSKEKLIIDLIHKIKSFKLKDFSIMEVCGTHTQSISKLGIRGLFYPEIKFISGPGCPVCVTSEGYIDAAIKLLNKENVILTTFGDLIKVKGSRESLIEQRDHNKKIKIVYSPLDAVKIAEENKDFQVVFLAVGFETTAPLIALSIKKAKEDNINNFSVLSSLKVMPPVIHKILKNKKHKIKGIICPGHVAVIKGEEYFKFITNQYDIPAVVSGFKDIDIISAIYFLTKQHIIKEKKFTNLYKTCVKNNGNLIANRVMEEVFRHNSCTWRGIGQVINSGLYINDKYKDFDALKKFNIEIKESKDNTCVCNEIILGKKNPNNCKFFGTKCTPEYPIGPCMVSSEGACSIYFKYGGINHYERNY